MMQAQSTPLNWTAISVIVSAVTVAVGIVGWFVVNHLTKHRERQRDSESRLRERKVILSDFESVIDKWTAIISGSQSLVGERNKSIPEIEPLFRKVRAGMDEVCQQRLDEQWKNYQQMQSDVLQDQYRRHPVTENTYAVYDDARKTLVFPLNEMKKIARGE